ncbi:type II toxin-antitoxin system RelE family toxin [Spirillospora sp. CA-255316]
MTYTVMWEAEATGLLSRFLDDPKGVSEVLDASEDLAREPRPGHAFAYGDDDRRLRVGRYRLMYHIDDEAREVWITHARI